MRHHLATGSADSDSANLGSNPSPLPFGPVCAGGDEDRAQGHRDSRAFDDVRDRPPPIGAWNRPANFVILLSSMVALAAEFHDAQVSSPA